LANIYHFGCPGQGMSISATKRLTFINKIIIGLAVSSTCMLAALSYAVIGISTIHNMEIEIARKDIRSATQILKLGDLLLAQQRYAGRYQILGSDEFRELFQQNAEQFTNGLETLKQVHGGNRLEELVKSHLAYLEMTSRIFKGEKVDDSRLRNAASAVSSGIELLRREQLQLLEEKLHVSGQHKDSTLKWTILLAVGGVLIALIASAYTIFTLVTSVRKLQKATHRIAEGHFDHDPQIPEGDEIGTLAQDFMRMATRLKELEQRSLDASPLTRLPGNIAIERVINHLLREQKPFAMCYLDLDNFKSYNDRYGYIRASEMIKEAGHVIYNAVNRLNDPEAFVGHIGGDDFVVIISEDLAPMACQTIIRDIDDMVPSYYSEVDRKAGAIEGLDRYGVPRRFPLVSISIAALVCRPGEYGSAAEIANAAAEVKDRIKGNSGSNYLIIHR